MIKLINTTAALAFSVVALAGHQAEAEIAGPKVNWDLNAHGPSRVLTRGIEAMSKYVAEQTGGKFNIKIHYGGALGKVRDNIDNIKLGSFQMGLWCSCYSAAKASALSALTLPFLPLDNIDEVGKVHQAYLKHPIVVKEADKWGAIFFTTQLIPESTVMAKGKAPKRLEDFKGMRIRGLGNTAAVIKLLGASTVSLPAPETYQGVQRGTMDGVSFPLYGYSAFKIDELSDWFSDDIKFGRLVTVSLMNKAAYNALPPQYQKLLQESVAVSHSALKKGYAGVEDRNFPKWKKMGIKRVKFDKKAIAAMEEKHGASIYQNWVKTVTKRGVPGQDLLDFLLKEASGS